MDQAAVTVDPDVSAFLNGNLILLIVSVIVALGLLWYAPRLVRVVVDRAFSLQLAGTESEPYRRAEIEKRARTVEHLANALLRIAIVAVLAFIVIGVFGWWGALAGLGLVIAALTLAGQSVVLDYIMGVLIVVEGQYYVGDWIMVGTVEGRVEEVGLRRTVIRDATGTVHSISNGDIRMVSNLTRVWATAEVLLPGVREEDVDRVAAIMDRVGHDLSKDPEWAGRVIEPPAFVSVADFTDLGLSLKMRGQVGAADRWVAASELRRRLAIELIEEGIELNQRGVPPRSERSPGPTQATTIDPTA